MQHNTNRYNMLNEPSKYRIMWNKWQDPITKTQTKLKEYFQNELRDQNLEQDLYDKENQFDSFENSQSNPISFMPIPAGLTLSPFMPDFSSFNFWIGHTNFNITHPILEIINQVPGVETLNLFSPYRFRIAVGQAFDENIVKQNVAQSIMQYFKKHDKQSA